MAKVVDAVKNTIAENFGGDQSQKLANKEHQFSHDEVPDLTGKVALVTGGSEGIGYGVTYTLLSKGIAHIYILSISKEVVDGAVEAIRGELGESAADRVTWIQCDMGDWKHVAEVAADIASKADRLDILVENAARGIMTWEVTHGIDRHMAVNHLGHVVLTSHLLPLLKKTADAGHTVRIGIQASNAHESSPKDTKFDSIADLESDIGGPTTLYGRSKLAGILYARYLNRHLTKGGHPNILANATHPGFVDTAMSTRDIHEPYPLGGYAMSVGMKPFKKDIWEGSVSMLYAATTIKESGQYICPPTIPEPGSDLSRDEELGEQMMALTREVIQKKTYPDSAAQGCPFHDH